MSQTSKRLRKLISCFGLSLVGCSTLSTPALRHETGETLAAGQMRGMAAVETNRAYAYAPTGSAAIGVVQSSSAFSSSHIMLGGAIGAFAGIEAQLRTFFSLGGSGWRVSAKYSLLKLGGFSIAPIVGYGRHSGSGTRTLTATSGDVDVVQTLSAKQLDLGTAISYRLGPSTAIYTGLTYYSTSISGIVDTTTVSASTSDLAPNLGIRFGLGRYDFDVELAMVKATDPVGGGSISVLVFGIGGGMNF